MTLSIKASSLTVRSSVLDIDEKVATLPKALVKEGKVKLFKNAVLSSKGDNIVVRTSRLGNDKILSFDVNVKDQIKFPKQLMREMDSLLLNQEFKK